MMLLALLLWYIKLWRYQNSRFLQSGLPAIDLALLTLFSIRIQTSSTRHMDSMCSILQAEDRSHLCWTLEDDNSLPPRLSHSELGQYICQKNPTRGVEQLYRSLAVKGSPWCEKPTLMFWTTRLGVVRQVEQVEADAEMVELPNAVVSPVCPLHRHATNRLL